ncbi:MAG TPA: D-alanine--D-alanine ligase family protein, partial [Thermoanaerobaculia bacterium]|nr:D-alanine--D-alanine ligase family protein [Thermoanaerobaculia bacterium]
AAQPALDGAVGALPAPGGAIAPSLRHLLDSSVEVVFPLVHGTWGEDGTLQGLCEMVGLPYVGCGVLPSAVAMDKLQAKRLLAAAGVPVVEFRATSRPRFDADPAAFLHECAELPLPLFVKPSVGGSSVGVQKVKRLDALEAAVRLALRFDDQVLVERGVRGREIEVGVLGLHRLEASRAGEIVPGAEFYDYADKYLTDAAQLIAPAELPTVVEERIRQQAIDAFAAIGGWGMARVDFLLEGERPYVNEINTIPGFTRISMYPRLWALTGVPLPMLVEQLVEIARRRHAERQGLDEGIKGWLAELGSRR